MVPHTRLCQYYGDKCFPIMNKFGILSSSGVYAALSVYLNLVKELALPGE